MVPSATLVIPSAAVPAKELLALPGVQMAAVAGHWASAAGIVRPARAATPTNCRNPERRKTRIIRKKI